MAMFGKVEELVGLVCPGGRLQRGLALLCDYRQGRRPDWRRILAALKPGQKAQAALEGDALFALFQCYLPKPRAEGRFEAHQRYTDLQYLDEGGEWIEVCPLSEQADLPPFDAQGNVFFPLGTAAHSRVRLAAGQVAVLFPQDAHAPCLRVEDAPETPVRKIVIKVRDAHLFERLTPALGSQGAGP